MHGGWIARCTISVFIWAIAFFMGASVVLPSGSASSIDEQARGLLETLARVEPRVERDKNAVVVFFDFFCPHCAEQIPMLLHWADTVPKDKVQVRFVPVISSDVKRVWLGYGFFVGTRVLGYGGSVALAQELFDLARSSRGFTIETVNEILAKHCGRERILGFSGLDHVREDMKAVDGELLRYKIQVVPSVGIAGKFLVTPDDLPSNAGQEAFVTLLNGFVSRMVAEDF